MFEDFLDFIGVNENDVLDLFDGFLDNHDDQNGQPVDLDGDGIADAIGFDDDGDGSIDRLGYDTDGDGFVDTFEDVFDDLTDGSHNNSMTEIGDDFSYDSDGDGLDDTIVHHVDTDGDGVADTDVIEHYYDSDGDGNFDAVVTETIGDYDHDSRIDYYSVEASVDIDGDGQIDPILFVEDVNGEFKFDAFTEHNIKFDHHDNHDNNDNYDDHDDHDDYDDHDNYDDYDNYDDHHDDILDEPIEVGSADVYEIFGHYDPSMDHDGVIGHPEDSLDSWHAQETDHTCAVAAQEFVLEAILGREFNEHDLREIAEDRDWLDNNGTKWEDIGELLGYYNVDYKSSRGNDLDDLKSSLDHGNCIIVGVDADELWNGANEEMFGPGMDANHAIQVIGFDESDPEHPCVIINDSGTANGQGVMVPADLFMDSWEDSGCFMVEAYH